LCSYSVEIRTDAKNSLIFVIEGWTWRLLQCFKFLKGTSKSLTWRAKTKLKELVETTYYKNQLVMDNQDKLFNQIKQSCSSNRGSTLLQAWISGHVWMKLDQEIRLPKWVWKKWRCSFEGIISGFHWDTNWTKQTQLFLWKKSVVVEEATTTEPTIKKKWHPLYSTL
jgi:hypothetical protein